MASVELDGRSLRLADLEAVAVHRARTQLSSRAIERIDRARQSIEQILDRGETVYGVNTGFGHLAKVSIGSADLTQLQCNLVRSHAVGMGAPFSIETTRAITLLRANVLAAGHSGVNRRVVEQLLRFLNLGIHPWIPQQGSVGASGDLAPLAHLALVLFGEGWVHGPDGTRVPTRDEFERLGIEAIELEAKEGLALINGTQAMTGLGALAVRRAQRLCSIADLIGAMTVEAKLGSHRPFDHRLHDLRPHPGQQQSAANMRKLLEGGTIAESHLDCDKVQDSYSLRCIPQVHGAARDSISHCASVLERELNSVTDNPTVFPDSGEVISGGNFHGQPVAIALDLLAIGIAELGAISERRIEQLVNPRLSGLPPFLSENAGLHSGFMISQVTAAALASENKGLCHPSSVDSIPTSANQEDHVSMGPISARQAMAVVENTERILGIELLTSCQALDLQSPLEPAIGPSTALNFVRQQIPRLHGDRILCDDQELAAQMIRDGSLLTAIEDLLGTLA
ncbi:MAG: histidine ammonia-lyase [Rickettsiales bacterium]|nr:histidine ammonia-lyase [Rickettsiales bacterium]